MFNALEIPITIISVILIFIAVVAIASFGAYIFYHVFGPKFGFFTRKQIADEKAEITRLSTVEPENDSIKHLPSNIRTS